MKPQATKEGPNEHIGEPIDAPVGFSPRVVKVPMHDNADVNPKYHEAKEDEKASKEPSKEPTVKKGAGWSSKDERMYQHIKDGGASEQIAAATVNKHRRKEGRLLHKKGTAMKSAAPQVNFQKATKDDGPGRITGPGSRGGTIAYYTKSGKPVYQSAVQKKYPQMAQMASNWTDNAIRSASSDHHATAAKQHLAAAFYAHHAGDSVAANEHMSHADYHHATAKFGHQLGTVVVDESKQPKHPASKRTLGWIDKHKETTRAMIHGHASDNAKKSLAAEIDADSELQKAITPSIPNGDNMSTKKKNEASDLFKAELGADTARPVTHCVHCTKPLTHGDLKKGLGVHFVAGDNDNPTSGGSGQVDPSRPGSGVSEHDVIAPLLKSCKGAEAGDGEEYPISKSEMEQMGMSVDQLEDGWYTISKSEMKRVGAEEYIGYLADRKNQIAKSGVDSVLPKRLQGTGASPPKPNASASHGADSVVPKRMQGTGATPPMPKIPPIPHGVDTVKPKRLQKGDVDGPHGYTPRAGGVQGPQGEPLVQWYKGDDEAIAKYCEQNGGYGPGTDESIRTEGNGRY